MAGETKMIIITSNEDLIQQLSTKKTTNTHIIDLDDEKQVTAMTKDNNNMINLALLAELSEIVRILHKKILIKIKYFLEFEN
jgi:hypothetical protein